MVVLKFTVSKSRNPLYKRLWGHFILFVRTTFAWFTSQDEVTNRLTANADYGVSIVESFTPPKNWLPGQTINKDVYAVNTGNVDAFVKETITGVLNYTYEQTIDTWDANCVELTPAEVTAIDGATTNEAGGFLAWTNAQVDDGNGETVTYPTGSINSRRLDPNGTDTGTEDPRWRPPATGDYIFRRSITNGTSAVGVEGEEGYVAATPSTFTYAGYHFVKGAAEDGSEDKYYEIVIGGDSHPTDGTETYPASTTPGYAAWNFDVSVASGNLGNDVNTGNPITVNEDGEITGTPKIRYVKEYKVENAQATFIYDDGEDDDDAPATLKVVYTPSQEATGNVEAAQAALAAAEARLAEAKAAKAAQEAAALADSANVANAEADYEDAVGNYNSKKSRYDQTKADFDYAAKLAEATNALYDAADARAIFQAELGAAETAKNDAWTAVKNKAAELVSTSGTYADVINMSADTSPVSYASLFQSGTNTLEARINELYTAYPARFGNIKSNMDDMSAKWTAIKTLLNGDGTAANPGIIADLNTLNSDTQLTAAQAETIRARLESAISDLNDRMNEYKNLYAAMQRAAATETMLTELGEADATVVNDTAALAAQFYNTGFDADDTGLNDLIDDYESKWNTWNTMNTTGLAAANQAWEDAVDAYNTAVGKAETNTTAGEPKGYVQNTTGSVQPELNDFKRLQGTAPNRTLKNQADLIVPDYAAENHISATDPRINTATYPDYTDYTGTATLKSGSTTEYEVTTANGGKVRKDTGAENDFTQLGIDPADASTYEEVNGSPAVALTLAQLDSAVTEANTNMGNKLTAYDAAKAAQTGRTAAIAAAQTAIDNAQSAVNDAQNAVNGALGAGSPVMITVNLAADESDLGWTPGLADDATSTAPEFYLNKVLKAGETSDKLIDSVYLDANTRSRAYKTLVFDLNVGMDSVQVTYDADQREYATDAVTPENGFNMTAGVTPGSDVVSWT